MEKCTVKIQIDKGAKVPVYSTPQAAGADICACFSVPDEVMKISSGKWALVPTGIRIALPEGFEAQIRPRSGLAAKYGVTVLNSPGTVDSDYRGEIKVILINHSDSDFVIHHGDRIAQMVIARHENVRFDTVFSLDETQRGEGGFGSTGIN